MFRRILILHLFVLLAALLTTGATTGLSTPVDSTQVDPHAGDHAAREPSFTTEDNGLTMSFFKGDGPLVRDIIGETIYADMDPVGQMWARNARIGDRWRAEYKEERSPGDDGPSLADNDGCSDPNNCDTAIVKSDVYLVGETPLPTSVRWQGHGSAVIESRRRKPIPDSLDQELWYRHHDDFEDFPSDIGGGTGPHCPPGEDYCWWARSAGNQSHDSAEVVICEAGVSVTAPFVDYSCPVEKVTDTFTASQQSRVTDSWGTDNKFCIWHEMDPWKYYFAGGDTIVDPYDGGSCRYQEPPDLP